ncbi:MAG: phosphoadenosine phosphosulfate reductase family protein [bacterium]
MNWKQVFKDWAQTESHQNAVRNSREIISQALSVHSRPYIAYSGGKDSTCMLHLVLKQAPDIMVLHWDYGPYYIPRDLEREFIRNARIIGARNIRVESSPAYRKLKRHAINVLGREYLGRLVPQLVQEGYDLAFVGLRKEESPKRRRRINSGRSITAIEEVWPLADWTWKDVWAYIFANQLPYPSVYDTYGPVVGWDRVRLTTFFDPEFDKLGASNVDGVLSWRFHHLPPGE